MAKKLAAPIPDVQPYPYPSPNVPLAVICRFARQIGERFQPDKIILFGSYAYGTPHAESDVDLLVIMPAYDAVNQAIRIDVAFEPPFSLDLIVRTPQQIERALRDGDWFLREVMEKGKVVYEAPHRRVGAKSRGRHGQRQAASRPNARLQGSSLLPLPASRGKVSQSVAARGRRRRAKNA